MKEKDLEYKLVSKKLAAAEQKILELKNQGLALIHSTTITQQAIEFQAHTLTKQLKQTQEDRSNTSSATF